MSGPNINKLVDQVTDKFGKIASGAVSSIAGKVKAITKKPKPRYRKAKNPTFGTSKGKESGPRLRAAKPIVKKAGKIKKGG